MHSKVESVERDFWISLTHTHRHIYVYITKTHTRTHTDFSKLYLLVLIVNEGASWWYIFLRSPQHQMLHFVVRLKGGCAAWKNSSCNNTEDFRVRNTRSRNSQLNVIFYFCLLIFSLMWFISRKRKPVGEKCRSLFDIRFSCPPQFVVLILLTWENASLYSNCYKTLLMLDVCWKQKKLQWSGHLSFEQ